MRGAGTETAAPRAGARHGLNIRTGYHKGSHDGGFADREGLEDTALCEAVRRAGAGLIDADLGGGVIKQRIARKGGGRSGGFRTIVVFRRGELAFFVHGFAKRDRDHLRRKQLSGL